MTYPSNRKNIPWYTWNCEKSQQAKAVGLNGMTTEKAQGCKDMHAPSLVLYVNFLFVASWDRILYEMRPKRGERRE